MQRRCFLIVRDCLSEILNGLVNFPVFELELGEDKRIIGARIRGGLYRLSGNGIRTSPLSLLNSGTGYQDEGEDSRYKLLQ